MTKFFAAILIALAACATSSSPPSPAHQQKLENEAAAALSSMRAQNPGIDSLLSASAGYAVFPNIGAAGAVYVGGAYGKGVLYQRGTPVGFVTLKQGSVGLTLGGKTYAELVLLRTQYDVDKLKAGKFELGGDVSAVVLTAGAGATGTLDPNTSVIVQPHGGLMGGITVSGQTIEFIPAG